MVRHFQYRIGVLGGTFDPVHLGHVAIAEAAAKEAGLDKLIVMPAGIQPFKQGKKITENYHREAMVRLAFSSMDIARVCRYELESSGISYTVKTLNHLREEYPGDEIFFIAGTDSFIQMEEWYMGRDIISRFPLIVSSRPGYREAELSAKINEYREKYAARTVKMSAKMPDISSTEVRNRLAAGADVSALLPESVERYIRENGLYR